MTDNSKMIRDLELNNLKQFFDLFSKILNTEFPEFSDRVIRYFLEKDFSYEFFEKAINEKSRKILVSYDEDNNSTGFLVATNVYGGVGFIIWLGVDKTFRKSGVGSALLSEYEKYCKTSLAHRVELNATPQVNVDFYKKNGFEEMAEVKESYFGGPAMIMGKVIGKWDVRSLG